MRNNVQQALTTLSSLPFQTILYFDRFYNIFFFIVEFLLLIYKYRGLKYPKFALQEEFLILFIFMGIQSCRFHTGTFGNKLESLIDLVIFLFTSLGSILGFVFIIQYQTYILLVEVFLSIFGLIQTVIQIFLVIYSIGQLKIYQKQQ